MRKPHGPHLTCAAMPASEYESRPLYVYVMAFVALLLFGVNFAASFSPECSESERVVVRVHAPAPPAPPMVMAPLTDLSKLNQELEHAREVTETAKIHIREASRLGVAVQIR